MDSDDAWQEQLEICGRGPDFTVDTLEQDEKFAIGLSRDQQDAIS